MAMDATAQQMFDTLRRRPPSRRVNDAAGVMAGAAGSLAVDLGPAETARRLYEAADIFAVEAAPVPLTSSPRRSPSQRRSSPSEWGCVIVLALFGFVLLRELLR